MLKPIAMGTAGIALLMSGLVLEPRALDSWRYLSGPRDEAAAADYRLSATSRADFIQAIDKALAAADDELAQSLFDVAMAQGLSLPADTAPRIAAAHEEASSRQLEDAWDGFVSGDAPNEAAFAGSLTADLVGYGDLRDLYDQAVRYSDGLDVDRMTIGFAAVGVALTAATIASFGSTSPAKAGVSTLKAAKRAGKLSPLLAREVTELAADAVDSKAFKALAASAGSLDLPAFRTAATQLVRPQVLTRMATLGTDVTGIGTRMGYRGTLQSLGLARSADEVGTISRLSATFGSRTRGILAMLGGAALTTAGVLFTASAWAVSALAWVLLAGLFVIRLLWKIAALLLPRRRMAQTAP